MSIWRSRPWPELTKPCGWSASTTTMHAPTPPWCSPTKSRVTTSFGSSACLRTVIANQSAMLTADKTDHQPPLLDEVARGYELADDAAAGLVPELLGQRLVPQHSDHCGAERFEVFRVVDEDPALSVLDLVFDPADATGHDRAALPHGFGDGEPEALDKALLHDHIGAALERVDDRRVLVGVLHRQLCDHDPIAHIPGHRVAQALQLAQHLGLFGVVGHRGGGRPGKHQVGIRPRRDVVREGFQNALGVLESVPS